MRQDSEVRSWKEISDSVSEVQLNAPDKIFLVRHGQTNDNLNRKLSGSGKILLNETGCRQSLELRKEIPDNIWRMYSSTLPRAVQTALIATSDLENDFVSGSSQKTAWGDDVDRNDKALDSVLAVDLVSELKNIVLDRNLNERGFGDLEGRCHSSIRAYSDPDSSPPNGESYRNFAQRTLSGFCQILEDISTIGDGRTVIVFCHAGVIRVFWSLIEPCCSLDRSISIKVENCSLLSLPLQGLRLHSSWYSTEEKSSFD